MVLKHLTHLQIDQILEENRDHDCPGVGEDHICVHIASIAELPTRFGDFHIVAFYNKRDNKEHAAIVRGDPTGEEDVPVRIHSECLTGDALGSLRCDCRDQLEASLRALGEMDCGVLLYLRQEGRGIGLTNKIRAYGLQDYGYDTVDANLALGFHDDEREYSTAAHMLHSLKVKSVNLMTNNPRKIQGLIDHGIKVTGRTPLVIPPNTNNAFYLHTKATRSGHLIEFGEHERLQEQMDLPVVEGMTEAQVDALEQVQE
ncbi:MAG TPA: GTP cyclohydrolase II [Chloroflexia bacterium]|nr:GTP cyclohydrolase II [Chloroflexia bacterium]